MSVIGRRTLLGVLLGTAAAAAAAAVPLRHWPFLPAAGLLERAVARWLASRGAAPSAFPLVRSPSPIAVLFGDVGPARAFRIAERDAELGPYLEYRTREDFRAGRVASFVGFRVTETELALLALAGPAPDAGANAPTRRRANATHDG